MPRATLTIEDSDDGSLNVGIDFGDKFDQDSEAHGLSLVLLQSVLGNAKTYRAIEDTVPEHDVEPSRIVTPEGV